MKRIIVTTIMMLLGLIPSFAQPTERLNFEKVIQADSVDKQSIFIALKEWFGMNFVSAKSVIEVEDKEAGLIIGNSITPYSKGGLSYSAYDGNLKYTLKIQIKDNRFKVSVTNFLHEGTKNPNYGLGIITTSEIYTDKGMNKKFHNNVWDDLKARAEKIANKYFLDFEAIKIKSTKSNDEDW